MPDPIALPPYPRAEDDDRRGVLEGQITAALACLLREFGKPDQPEGAYVAVGDENEGAAILLVFETYQGPRRYACRVCSASEEDRNNLEWHVLIHHPAEVRLLTRLAVLVAEASKGVTG